ncbi:MAG: Ig-like domain-containing protein [Candidatus Micrarchaeota archaeon]|nr:Ig-like domain-containing protein [Candidatus Micrarchaeota archaeon]
MKKILAALCCALFLLLAANNASAACTITPASQTITAGGTAQFTISHNTSDPDINYRNRSAYGSTPALDVSNCGPTTLAAAGAPFSASCDYSTQGTYTLSVTISCSDTFDAPNSCSTSETCSAQVTVNPATTDLPPVVTITGSPSNSYFKAGQTIEFSGTASDDYKVTSVSTQVCCPSNICGSWTAASLAAANSSTTWSYSWVPTADAIGVYHAYDGCIFKAKAVDNSSLTSSEAQVTFSTVASSTTTPASVLSTQSSKCNIQVMPPSIQSPQTVSVTAFYSGFGIVTGVESWNFLFDCGNGKTASATCLNSSFFCSAQCSYDKQGTFAVKVKEPTTMASVCGGSLVSAKFLPAANATPVPTPTPNPELLPCPAGECKWQKTCYAEGSKHPSFNETGNCFYGTCSNGEWKPKPEGTACGGGSMCCAGQCRPPACFSDTECATRLKPEGQECVKLKCENRGSCASACKPDELALDCGGPECASGSKPYCSTPACGAHQDGLCNCGESADDYLDECGSATAGEPVFGNQTFYSPMPIVFGEPANISIRYDSPSPLSRIECSEDDCMCYDVPNEQMIHCQIESARQIEYSLSAMNERGKTFATKIRITAAGVAFAVTEAPFPWHILVIGVGLFGIGGYFAYKHYMMPTVEKAAMRRYYQLLPAELDSFVKDFRIETMRRGFGIEKFNDLSFRAEQVKRHAQAEGETLAAAQNNALEEKIESLFSKRIQQDAVRLVKRKLNELESAKGASQFPGFQKPFKGTFE